VGNPNTKIRTKSFWIEARARATKGRKQGRKESVVTDFKINTP
jgi:hypothetical protein